MISDKPKVFMKAAAGVIFKEVDDRRFILLIQRAKDDHWPLHYEFPRGKCDKPIGEDIIKCLKREVKEETGLDITPVKYIDKFTYLADRGERETTCYNFLCRMDNADQKIKLSKEHDDFKWIGEVGEAGLLVMPEQRQTIEKALNMGRSITMDPDNNFSDNNMVEEYLEYLNDSGDFSGVDIPGTNVTVSHRLAIKGGFALAVLLAWAVGNAYRIYKNVVTGAIAACKRHKGEAKNNCMEKYKELGRKKQIEMLQDAKKYCSKTPDPQKCHSKIDEKISKIKTKIK